MRRSRCTTCGLTAAEGRHRMSPAEGQAYPPAHCPKCGGGSEDGWPTCVTTDTGYYVCSCGVRWSESLATRSS